MAGGASLSNAEQAIIDSGVAYSEMRDYPGEEISATLVEAAGKRKPVQLAPHAWDDICAEIAYDGLVPGALDWECEEPTPPVVHQHGPDAPLSSVYRLIRLRDTGCWFTHDELLFAEPVRDHEWQVCHARSGKVLDSAHSFYDALHLVHGLWEKWSGYCDRSPELVAA